MKYLKKFENHIEYDSAKEAGLILPNVSLCAQENEMHYNPYVDPYNGHAYVDLGLPSGTKWATMNVGANYETDYGLYFQWGDTQGYTAEQVGIGEGQKEFGWADYKFNPSGDGSTFTKYTGSDGKTVLDLEDDAARAIWGGSWKMPTGAQFQELLNTEYCTNVWTTVNGINGRLFTSVSNGNTLFIPAAGWASHGSVSVVGSYCSVWSSSLDSSNVTYGQCLFFNKNSVSASSNHRFSGYPVRGVVG